MLFGESGVWFGFPFWQAVEIEDAHAAGMAASPGFSNRVCLAFDRVFVNCENRDIQGEIPRLRITKFVS